MRIRKLKDGEKGGARRLYEEIFSEDSPSFVDYYYTEKMKDNTIYVVEEGGLRASAINAVVKSFEKNKELGKQ